MSILRARKPLCVQEEDDYAVFLRNILFRNYLSSNAGLVTGCPDDQAFQSWLPIAYFESILFQIKSSNPL